MREDKLGGKKHGMVLIISIGKKGDKDPAHVADLDKKKDEEKDVKKATVDEILQEAKTMRGAGDRMSADKFENTAQMMQRPNEFKEGLQRRFSQPAANLLNEPDISQLLYEEGKESPDYIEAKGDKEYMGLSTDDRKKFLQLMSQMSRQKQQIPDLEREGEEGLARLKEEDPTKYFADEPFRKAWEFLKGY